MLETLYFTQTAIVFAAVVLTTVFAATLFKKTLLVDFALSIGYLLLLTKTILPNYIAESIETCIAPALIVAAAISSIILKYSSRTPRSRLMLVLITVLSILYVYFSSFSIRLTVELLSLSAITLCFWHTIPEIFLNSFFKKLEKTHILLKLDSLRKEENFILYTLCTSACLFSAIIFLLISFNVSVTKLPYILLARLTWISIVYISAVLIPVSLLVEELNIRVYNKEYYILFKPSLWKNFSKISLLLTVLSLIALFTHFYSLGNSVLAWRKAVSTLVFTLTSSTPLITIPLLLYEKYSLKKHLNSLSSKLQLKPIQTILKSVIIIILLTNSCLAFSQPSVIKSGVKLIYYAEYRRGEHVEYSLVNFTVVSFSEKEIVIKVESKAEWMKWLTGVYLVDINGTIVKGKYRGKKFILWLPNITSNIEILNLKYTYYGLKKILSKEVHVYLAKASIVSFRKDLLLDSLIYPLNESNIANYRISLILLRVEKVEKYELVELLENIVNYLEYLAAIAVLALIFLKARGKPAAM